MDGPDGAREETPIRGGPGSLRDRIVADQRRESGRLYREILAANPEAPVTSYVGRWAHSAEMHATARLPLALVNLKLIKLDEPLPATAKP